MALSNKESRGGHSCEFVDPPPNGLQTDCPVCLLILKEPCLISCCGHKFCRECIEHIKADEKACALCNKVDFSSMRELGLERALNDLEVWCSYRKEGCEWRGKLGKLDEHLNQIPAFKNRQNGCQFTEIECVHKCGLSLLRRNIITHETQQCEKRPYSCDYCQDCHSTFENVTKVHYLQCGKYPVACPNHCDKKVEHQDLNIHLKEKCPLMQVDCPFSYAGCREQMLHKDVPDHIKEEFHLTLLAAATQRLAKENQELKAKEVEYCKTMESALQEVRNDNQKLHRELEEVKAVFQNVPELVMKNLQIMENEVRALKEMTKRQTQEMQQHIHHSGFPVYFQVKQSEDEVYSPPYYTHPHGYKMCVRVNPKGNLDGKGTHVSIYNHMMQGPFDDSLKWPFRGEITIQIMNQIMNQTGDHNHGEMAEMGWGRHKCLTHDELQCENTPFLKDNSLQIRVVRVTLN